MGCFSTSQDIYGNACFESSFIDGVEDLPLFLIHTVSASQAQIKRTSMECFIVGVGTTDLLGRVTVGANNNGWAFSLRQLLQYAGN
eukprot:3076862-Amphidinium_carterae.1